MGIERSKANCLAASSAAEVWSAANMGMNFIVHIGRFYDRCGARVTAYAAAALKVAGLLGMALAQVGAGLQIRSTVYSIVKMSFQGRPKYQNMNFRCSLSVVSMPIFATRYSLFSI